MGTYCARLKADLFLSLFSQFMAKLFKDPTKHDLLHDVTCNSPESVANLFSDLHSEMYKHSENLVFKQDHKEQVHSWYNEILRNCFEKDNNLPGGEMTETELLAAYQQLKKCKSGGND